MGLYMARIANDVTELIGNTPLVKLNRITKGIDATVVCKCEFSNPASSVKDRIGMSMIKAAEDAGLIDHDTSIIEPTTASRQVVAEWITDHGVRAVLGDGYYAFMDMGPWLDRAGMADTAELGTVLGERFGLAVVPGIYFSDFGARWIRFSYALPPEVTRGATERLWQAVSSL